MRAKDFVKKTEMTATYERRIKKYIKIRRPVTQCDGLTQTVGRQEQQLSSEQASGQQTSGHTPLLCSNEFHHDISLLLSLF